MGKQHSGLIFSNKILRIFKYINLPVSDSCQTMPSKCTLVPGSQGPRASGSVMTPMSELAVTVPTVRCLQEVTLPATVSLAREAVAFLSSPKFFVTVALESSLVVDAWALDT